MRFSPLDGADVGAIVVVGACNGLMVLLLGRLESLLAPFASPFLLWPDPEAIDADVEDECDGNCDGNP